MLGKILAVVSSLGDVNQNPKARQGFSQFDVGTYLGSVIVLLLEAQRQGAGLHESSMPEQSRRLRPGVKHNTVQILENR